MNKALGVDAMGRQGKNVQEDLKERLKGQEQVEWAGETAEAL